MRAAFRLLTILCLLWCAVGVGEPALAHPAPNIAHAADDVPDTPDPAAPATPDVGAHHHCPVSPALPAATTAPACLATATTPHAPSSATLHSLTRAPPLQPPAA